MSLAEAFSPCQSVYEIEIKSLAKVFYEPVDVPMQTFTLAIGANVIHDEIQSCLIE